MRRTTFAAFILAALALVPGRIAIAQTSRPERARVLVADFLASYDKLPTEGGTEFLIKTFGRGSYKRLLERWYQGITTGSPPSFELDSSYEGLVRTIRKDAPDQEAPFQEAARELTGLTYRNFDLYLDAAASGGAFTSSGGLNARLLDEALATEQFAVEFEEMVTRERAAKTAIWAVLDDPRLRSKVPFYRFVYERVSRMRERVLARHEAVRRERRALAHVD